MNYSFSMSCARTSLLICAVLAILGSAFAGHLPNMHGMLSRHMLTHILLMNAGAPLLAAALIDAQGGAGRSSLPRLITSSLLQLLLLFGWHTPTAMAAAMAAPQLALFMHLSLFAAAVWFWHRVFVQASEHIWSALAALLVTAKLYCLMAALLVFAPRSLYLASGTTAGIQLADQQFAGVIMVVACPLSYVLVATVLVARWIAALHLRNARPDHVPPATGAR